MDEAPDAEDVDDDRRRERTGRSKQRGAPRISSEVREEIEEIQPTPEEAACPCCGAPRWFIGYEETRKLKYQPASYYVRVIRRPKLACPDHEEAGVVTPELPPQVIHKGLPGASTLAQVVTAKYRDHLPLDRQSSIYARQGVYLARSTLCDWVGDAAGLLDPVDGLAVSGDVLAGNVARLALVKPALLANPGQRGCEQPRAEPVLVGVAQARPALGELAAHRLHDVIGGEPLLHVVAHVDAHVAARTRQVALDQTDEGAVVALAGPFEQVDGPRVVVRGLGRRLEITGGFRDQRGPVRRAASFCGFCA